MNRRTFLVVIGTTAASAAAQTLPTVQPAADDVLDAGPISGFADERVYDAFRDQGVLIVRRGDELFALSPVCTHRGCKVRPQADACYLCKCHGSEFDPDGKVLSGPATRDLLRLKVTRSADGRLLVRWRKPRLDPA